MERNPFSGVWRLVSCDASRANGAGARPVYGQNPIGRLYYDSAGNMSVHIMRRDRPRFKGATKFGATASEMRGAYESYEAYFSSYVIEPGEGRVHHTVIGGLFPNWEGTVQSRYYRFEGEDRLILSTAPFGQDSGDAPVVTLVWERISLGEAGPQLSITQSVDLPHNP